MHGNVAKISSHPGFEDHTGYRFRDEWLSTIAASDMPAAAYRTAMKLYLAFNCQTRQCNPRFETMATEMNVNKRTVERGVRDLEMAGMIEPGKRGARRNFVLTSPTEVPTTAVGTVPTNTAQSSDNCCRNIENT